MELDWLETFLAVVDRGGFTAASQHLHRAQSRVSAHIAALERELAVQLFDRSRRPAALTAAGEVFVGYAREVVAELETARSAVGFVSDLEQNRLTVVTTPAIGAAFLPRVMSRLTAELPGVRLQLIERNGDEDLRRGVGEGAVMAVLPVGTSPSPPGLEQQVLWQERLSLVVDRYHRLAGHRGPVPLDRVAAESVVVCRSSVSGDPFASLLRHASGVPARSRLTVSTPQTLVAAVRAGAGVGLLGAVALQGLDLRGLTVFGLRGDVVVRHVAAFWSETLLATDVGRRVHRAVLEAPLPPGAHPPTSAQLHAVPLEPGEGAADG